MITIIYSTHKDSDYNNKFKQHLLQTVGVSDVQVLEYSNHNQYSLSELYNKGIEDSTYNIIVCCHNDIKLEKNWGKKLIQDFEDNSEYGIIGKAGSCYFSESGVFWDRLRQTMVGQVYHHPEGQKKWLSRYSPKFPFLIPVVTIDGLFISFDKTKIKHKFDESYGKFHFYDHGFAVPNYLDGVKIGVTSSFEITHQSIGEPNQEFWESKDKFLEKYINKLPLDLKPQSVYAPFIKEKTFKKLGRIAIIIPTKGKVEMLIDCINSFFDNCKLDRFDIFIADTGSTEEEKNQIKSYISNFNNVRLIEYDYYNFAKINNDVVKNHINDNYEFLLFCNNDIKILNDVITGMLSIYDKHKKAGTVGCRLHYEDNTVQHDGVFLGINKTNSALGVDHLNVRNYYNYYNSTKEVFGNTGGLLMIRKNTFELCGLFNENYISCFEDVELNVMTLSMGFVNFLCGDCVAYHYESMTRNEDPENLDKLRKDYIQNLVPIVKKNLELIKHKIVLI
jgi:GT2 family glycosyltransferase